MLQRFTLSLVLATTVTVSLALAAPAEDLVVANAISNTLDRVSTQGRGSVTTIRQYTTAPFDVVVSADGPTAYVSLPANSSVEAVNLATGTVTSIPTGASPQKMALNGNGTRLYVATSIGITTIDTASNTAVAAESISLTESATSVDVFGAFLAAGTTDSVCLFDVSGTPPFQLGCRTIGARVHKVLFATGGTTLYTALATRASGIDENGNPTDFGNVHVFRVSSLNLKTVVDLGFFELQDMTIRDTYIGAPSQDGNVYWIDTATDTVATTTLIPHCCALADIALGQQLYIGNQTFNEIQIVRLGRSPENDRVDGTIPLSGAPQGIAVIPTSPKGKGKPQN